MRYGPSGKSGKLYSPSLPVFVLRVNPLSVFVMLTSAPASAAPCSSVTVPRTDAVVTCARAPNALHRTSARPASTTKIERNLPNSLFEFKRSVFIRLPLEEIFARKKRNRKIRSAASFIGLPRSHDLFHPNAFSRRTPTLKHYGT